MEEPRALPPKQNQNRRRWLTDQGLKGRFVVLTEGPSRKHPDRNNRMEILDLKA